MTSFARQARSRRLPASAPGNGAQSEEFVVGDDWRSAVGVAGAVGGTAVLATADIAAWWLLPIAVLHSPLRLASPRGALTTPEAATCGISELVERALDPGHSLAGTRTPP